MPVAFGHGMPACVWGNGRLRLGHVTGFANAINSHLYWLQPAPHPMQSEPVHAPFDEHLVLCRAYGAVQERCSQLLAQQRAEIERLQAQAVRLRAAVIVRETTLALAREDHARLVARLMGEADRGALAADLVICQTGCLGHGDYWRDQDRCRRTGQGCVFADAQKLTA